MTVDDAPMMPEVRHYKIAGGSYRANSPLYAMQRGGVGTAHYDSLGAGYCRDEGMHRLDGYYIPLAELSVRERYTTLPRTSAAGPSDLACAEHCSDDSNCLGYAIDRDTCTIYTRTAVDAPPEWHDMTEGRNGQLVVGSDIGEHNSQIVQTNRAEDAQCWVKLSTDGEPQDLVGAAVYVLHILMVAGMSL